MSSADQPDKPQESWLNRIKSVLGLQEHGSIREDIEDALQEPDTAEDFSPKERLILVNVLGMRDVRVSDVMTPRARILGVSETATLAELLDIFRKESHGRLPVYGETLDDPKGMVHIRDLLAHLAGPEGTPPLHGGTDRLAGLVKDAPLLRPMLFVPPSTPALDLLVRMQSKRLHMALVIDEYGETDGLVTMEDLVEVIVGDIEDEHDLPEPSRLDILPDGSIAASAAATLDEVSRALGIDLSSEASDYDVDSLGGFVTAVAGRVPQAGERLEGPAGLTFEIVEALPRRIKRLIIHTAGSSAPDKDMDGAASEPAPKA